MKRIWIVVVFATLVLLGGSMGVAENIRPFYQHTAYANTTLTLKGKVATCVGTFKAKDANSIIDLTVFLRKESGGRWINVKSWSTKGVKNAMLTRSVTLSSSGKYRVVARGTVKDPAGKVLEKISVNSSIVTL